MGFVAWFKHGLKSDCMGLKHFFKQRLYWPVRWEFIYFSFFYLILYFVDPHDKIIAKEKFVKVWMQKYKDTTIMAQHIYSKLDGNGDGLLTDSDIPILMFQLDKNRKHCIAQVQELTPFPVIVIYFNICCEYSHAVCCGF